MRLREHEASGLEYLDLVTALLQDARQADPTAGVWEAADLQWWWRRDQHPDPRDQTFWLDSERPVAAVTFMNWGDRLGCDLLAAGIDASTAIETAWPRVQSRLDAHRDAVVETTISNDDQVLIDAFVAAGFAPTDEIGVETWMTAAERPAVRPLATGFELVARNEGPTRPHHMIRRNGPHVDERLAECSLYRPDLDLAVFDSTGAVAAYGLFWPDPVTGVGLVEPMRTEDQFQQRGFARHVLAAGLERLAGAGCARLKISYIVGNDAARDLYLGSGFHPASESRTYRRVAG